MNLKEILSNILDIASDIQNNTLIYHLYPLVKAGKRNDPADLLMEITARFKFEIQHSITPDKQKVKKAIEELKLIKREYKIEKLYNPIKELLDYIEGL